MEGEEEAAADTDESSDESSSSSSSSSSDSKSWTYFLKQSRAVAVTHREGGQSWLITLSINLD